jgi:hypothetical protein
MNSERGGSRFTELTDRAHVKAILVDEVHIGACIP